MGERIEFGLYESCRNRGSVGHVSVWVAGVFGGSGWLAWCYVCVCCEYGFFM